MSTNDPQQQQMIRDAMKSIAERKPGRTKLVYDKTKRTIVAVAAGTEPPRALNITADDADMFATITVSSQWLRERWHEIKRDSRVNFTLRNWDDGDALTHAELGVQASSAHETGTILLGDATPPQGIPIVLVLDAADDSKAQRSTFLAPDGALLRASGWREVAGEKQALEVCFADVQPELASRRSGILETAVLSDTTVLLIGLGTGGAHAAIELAKCGVGNFILIDRDRLSVGNVVRHPGGISHVGRYKVAVIRDLIHEKNPNATVSIHPVAVEYENQDAVRDLIKDSDVVICGTDNRESKLLINRLCLDAGVVAVYGGAFRRAYGGQVLRVRPKQSPCHQCFVAAMPDEASNVEISSAEDAEAIAYSDQPVAVEPGLSLDVLPIANMLTKLALLELVADKDSSLNMLKRDFNAPWYLWINQPEAGTPYADWPPLSESIDEMTICRWYGIYFDRDPECPACGEFLSALAASYDLDLATIGELPTMPEKQE
jgi:molybdopterin/thiamine biosynthesis adenylyltransferase